MTSEFEDPPEVGVVDAAPAANGAAEPRVAGFGRSPGTAVRPAALTSRQPLRSPPPAFESYDQPGLRNPYVLAGIAVFAAIVLAMVVVFVFSGGKGSGASSGNNNQVAGVSVDPLTPIPGRGIAAKSIATATVRSGPGLEYDAIAELARNQDVEVIGRNNEGTWFAIYYPPGSVLVGWLPKGALNLSTESATIPLLAVTPLPRPTIERPTAAPQPTESATATPSVTTTPTPAAGPADLVASVVAGTCQAGQRLLVKVTNAGPGALAPPKSITVLVQALDGSQISLASSTPLVIQPNQSIDIDTNYIVNQRVIVTIDPLMTLGDPNPANNRVDCAVAAPGPVLTTPVRNPPIVPTPIR